MQEINTAKWGEVYGLGRLLPAASRRALMEDEVHFLVWTKLENQREDRHRCRGITGREFPGEPGGELMTGHALNLRHAESIFMPDRVAACHQLSILL